MEVAGLASVWVSQESCPDREVVGRVVLHVQYPDDFKAAPVHPEDIIASCAEYGALSYLCPSIQVLKPLVLLEVPDQFNKTRLRN